MASMPRANLSQRLRVWRGNGMDCRVSPAMTGIGKGCGEKRSVARVAFFWRATQSSTTRKSPIETLSPSTYPPSCHGSPMASMPRANLSQRLRVWRGNGMDCRVEPCNDGEWKGLQRQKERSACCVLLARDSVFDNTQSPYRVTEPLDTPSVMPWLDHGIHAACYPVAKTSGWARKWNGLQGRALQ
jgi:hypothetical protein